ncbi:ankyrin, partial [Lojkania enalia]
MIGALTQYAINLDARAPDKKSAVHIAAAHCDFQTLHLLIKAKADLNLQDEHGRTPLHYAAQRNRPDAVIALIEAGANREIKDIQGRTLIHCAVPHYSLNDLSNLVSKVLKIRGSRPRQLNEPDVDGWTPIHWACKGGENGVIRLLRAAQANPTKRDKKGWTPRHIAIFH